MALEGPGFKHRSQQLNRVCQGAQASASSGKYSFRDSKENRILNNEELAGEKRSM